MLNQLIARTSFAGVTAFLLTGTASLLSTSVQAASAVQDRVALAAPGEVRLEGILGERFARNLEGRLLPMNENDMLDGFRKRPGKHDWIGEHVGKWMHAASLVAENTSNTELRAKLDRVAAELMATQEPDGYLGTYIPEHRMVARPPHAWDVWVHKYDLIGLLAYHQLTGNEKALATARRAADHLLNVFAPGKHDIIKTGEHVGMASTSVLEPMVVLYRTTGDSRYLDFSKDLVKKWESEGGPKIISRLQEHKCVKPVGNAKAYEMLSCLVGLCELYRETGDPQYLSTAQIAWEDVVRDHLYITGTGSSKEHWLEARRLPYGPQDNMGEACVTVTWMQLNMHLYRLTGDVKYVEELERSVYNHLLGAQKPEGDHHCYYTPLAGKKPYSTDFTCCFSSLGRGVAMIPTLAFAKAKGQGGADQILLNLLGPGEAKIPLSGGGSIALRQESNSPVADQVTLHVSPDGPREAELQVRIPRWAENAAVAVNGEENRAGAPGAYLPLRRTWKPGDKITVRWRVTPKVVAGDVDTSGRVALTYGPVVLAADEGSNPGLGDVSAVAVTAKPGAGVQLKTVGGGTAPIFELTAQASGKEAPLKLEPFYNVGADRTPIAVWFPAAN